MLKILNWLFSGHSLSSRLDPQKKIKLHGITFTIRKMNPLDYAAGAQSLVKVHDIYQSKGETKVTIDEKGIEKVKAHYRDVLMSGVVSVKCLGKYLAPTRKPADGKILVDNLMTDWSLAEELYQSIIEFTYGKKKIKAIISSNQKA